MSTGMVESDAGLSFQDSRGGAAPREIVLTVGAPAHGGHCVARLDDDPAGRVVFVRHALPGERVRARITQMTARTWRAETVEVLDASPDRVAPAWAEAGAGGVGGGELSHVALGAQRTWKRWVLADCLRRIGGVQVADAVASLTGAGGPGGVPVEPMASEAVAESSESARARALAGTGTRTRISLTVTPQGRVGMHGHRSGQVLAVRRLPLAVRAIEDLELPTRALWRRHLVPGARVTAVAPSAGDPLVLVGSQVLTATGRPTGRRRVAEVVDASGIGLGELRYTVHADGFWQVHKDAPTALVDLVTRGVLTGSLEGAVVPASRLRVLELYSGVGLLTLPLAHLAGQVVSLEGSEQAVGDARRNLHGHGSTRLAVGRVSARSVEELGRSFGTGGDQVADVVVMDPPRSGAGRQVVEAVAGLGAARVVLVACDPAALARDLGTFLSLGYRPAAMRALDMFPHTHHFETIAVLQRS